MDDFDLFWEEVLDFCESTGLSSSYVEEEFIINGELIAVFPTTKKTTTK